MDLTDLLKAFIEKVFGEPSTFSHWGIITYHEAEVRRYIEISVAH